MKSYIRMKYEQFLCRLFDRVCDLLFKTRMDWYPKHRLCQKEQDRIYQLEDKIFELEEENFRLEYHMIDKDEEIETLCDILYYYEKDLYE